MTFDEVPADLAAALAHSAHELGPFAVLRYVDDVASTNDVAMALALAGAPEGTSVLAGRQRAGRGRRGRSWFSPAGAGIYLSILVRPPARAASPGLVTLGAGVAVAHAIRRVSGLVAELKWPNDIVVGRPWRKLGGVLCEAASVGSAIETIIIGIGINRLTVSYPRELADTATALESELGRAVDAAGVVVEILRQTRTAMAHLQAGDGDVIRRDWRSAGRAGLNGAPVRWREGDGLNHGRAHDIDDDGALLVDVDGRRERLVSGEVTWEALSRE